MDGRLPSSSKVSSRSANLRKLDVYSAVRDGFQPRIATPTGVVGSSSRRCDSNSSAQHRYVSLSSPGGSIPATASGYRHGFSRHDQNELRNHQCHRFSYFPAAVHLRQSSIRKSRL